MTTKTRRQPQHSYNSAGVATVQVPLARGAFATVYLSDFKWMAASGMTEQWMTNKGGSGIEYVRCGAAGATGHLISVARVIMQAQKGQIVRYRDGDRLNLGRDNLYLTEGRAGAREVTLFARPEAAE